MEICNNLIIWVSIFNFIMLHVLRLVSGLAEW